MRAYMRDIIKIASEETHQITSADLKKIDNSISQWLSTKQKLDKKLEITARQLLHEEKLIRLKEDKLSADSISNIIKIREGQKFRIRGLRNEEDMKEHFKNGYRLIHYTREIFTKQKITYRILFGEEINKKKTGNLYEKTFSMEDLLQYVRLSHSEIEKFSEKELNIKSISNASFQLTIGNRQTFEEYIEGRKAKLAQVASKIDAPDLWDSLIELRDRRGYKKNAVNLGRLYEVYRILRYHYPSITYIAGRTETLGESILERNTNSDNEVDSLIKGTMGENVRGWQLGDLGLEQFKAVLNADASLMDISTMENVLKDIQSAIRQDTREELRKSLINIFTVEESKLNQKIDIAANEEAIKNLNKIIGDLPLVLRL